MAIGLIARMISAAVLPILLVIAFEELLAYATTEQRALVTENVADFMPLATQWADQHTTHAGLVFTNPRRFNRATLAYPGNLIASLREFLADPPITGDSWIWWL